MFLLTFISNIALTGLASAFVPSQPEQHLVPPCLSASDALNKWMKGIIRGDYVVFGLRHSLRDRLRAVECPSDIIDQIGEWTTTGLGHRYGKGYSVEISAKWMERIKTSFCLTDCI